MRRAVTLLVLVLCITQGLSQTIDQKITDAQKNVNGFDIVADERSETLRIELDILMKLKDYVEMEREMSKMQSVRRKKRKAIKNENLRWPNKEVPYEIASELNGASDTAAINSAIAEWNNFTCLNWRPAVAGDAQRVRFIDGNSGCASYIGKTGDAVQNIFLGSGCRFKDIVVHEMGHAAGFWHEQSRPDRDAFVNIISANIQSNLEYNFEKRPESDVNNFSVPYDYRSVMHYSQYAFSTNGMPTIEAKQPEFQNIMGNAPGLSFRDIKLANLMYNCNSACSSVVCPGEGFQGKDCNCYCSTGNANNPVAVCSAVTTTVATTTTTAAGASTSSSVAASTTTSMATTTTTVSASTTTQPQNCLNSIRWCNFWANRGLCSVFPGFMNQFCKKACGQCSGVTETCLDYGRYCRFWQSRGYCQMRFVRYMTKNCAKTCGFCTPGVSGSSDDQTGAQPQNGSEKQTTSFFAILISVITSYLYIRH